MLVHVLTNRNRSSGFMWSWKTFNTGRMYLVNYVKVIFLIICTCGLLYIINQYLCHLFYCYIYKNTTSFFSFLFKYIWNEVKCLYNQYLEVSADKLMLFAVSLQYLMTNAAVFALSRPGQWVSTLPTHFNTKILAFDADKYSYSWHQQRPLPYLSVSHWYCWVVTECIEFFSIQPATLSVFVHVSDKPTEDRVHVLHMFFSRGVDEPTFPTTLRSVVHLFHFLFNSFCYTFLDTITESRGWCSP